MEIPKEVIVEHILPYLSLRELYPLRCDPDYARVFNQNIERSNELLEASIEYRDETLLFTALRSLNTRDKMVITSPLLVRPNSNNSQTGYIPEELISKMFKIAIKQNIECLVWVFEKFSRIPILQKVLVENKRELCTGAFPISITEIAKCSKFHTLDYSQIIWDDNMLLISDEDNIVVATHTPLTRRQFSKYLAIFQDMEILRILDQHLSKIDDLLVELFNADRYTVILYLVQRKFVDKDALLHCYSSWMKSNPDLILWNDESWNFVSHLRKIM